MSAQLEREQSPQLIAEPVAPSEMPAVRSKIRIDGVAAMWEQSARRTEEIRQHPFWPPYNFYEWLRMKLFLGE